MIEGGISRDERSALVYSRPGQVDAWIAGLAVAMLEIPAAARVLDLSCAAGAWFLACPEGVRATGVDPDVASVKIAQGVFPGACIVADTMINHILDVENQFDYVLGDPPTKLLLKPQAGQTLPMRFAGANDTWAATASLEIGVRALMHGGYLAMMLPEGFYNDTDGTVIQWLDSQTRLVAHLTLPGREHGLYIWQKGTSNPFGRADARETEVFRAFIAHKSQADDILSAWQDTRHYNGYLTSGDRQAACELAMSIATSPRDVVKIVAVEPLEVLQAGQGKLKQACDDVITVTMGENHLVLKPNGLRAALKIAEAQERGAVSVSYQTREYKIAWNEALTLTNLYQTTTEAADLRIVQYLKGMGVEPNLDPAFTSWLARKQRWFKRQDAPFEQWIQRTENSPWEEIHLEDGLRTTHADLFKQQDARMERLSFYYPFISELWGTQRDDVIRASLKQSSIMNKKQGLGKTRSGYAWALLTGVRHALFVVPGHLIGEWEEEAEELGLEVKVIETEADTWELSDLNIISYDLLASPLTAKDKARADEARVKKNERKRYPRHRTFAHALARRVRAVCFDEAHLLSNKQTNRTQACKRLKPKWKLDLTGTVISNKVDGLWSVLDVLYGGAHGSNQGHPLFPYNHKEFQEKYVSYSTVQRQYTEGGRRGASRQTRASIRNVRQFQAMMAPKSIRRVTDEPEVTKDVVIPTYRLVDHEIRPNRDHLQFYRWHLIEFAEWLKKQLDAEKQGKAMSSTELLAQLTRLSFASTMPQHSKVNLPANQWTDNQTPKQQACMELIMKAIENGKRVFVVSLRPDFATMLNRWLSQAGIKAVEFTGKVDRRERIALKKRLKYDESIKVVLGTYGVAATGLNLHFLNECILVDLDWTWSRVEQLFHRLLRPAQTMIPDIHILRNNGMLDAYVHQHCVDKRGAAAEGIDYREDADFVDEWVSWRDFSIKMLMEEGLW